MEHSENEALRQRYCPPLDEALFFALASDFDLAKPDQERELAQILDGLKEQAVVEQELELAPVPQNDTTQGDSSNAKSRTASSHRRTTTTGIDDNIASVTTGVSDLTTSDAGQSTGDHLDADHLPEELENASPAEKEKWLKLLFPAIEPVQITETVARCDADLQRSIDELLNLSFINDDVDRNYEPRPIQKGVDAFVEGGNTKKAKKKKKNRKHEKEDLYLSDGTVSSGAATPNSNVWSHAAEDVEFIVSRTNMSTASVKSVYHLNNLNLALTIRSLVTKEADAQASLIRTDHILQLQAAELKLDMEDVPDKHIYGALLLAAMLPSAAKDLIDAMMTQPGRSTRSGKLIGIVQYAPVNLSDDEPTKRLRPRSPTTAGDSSLLMGQAGVHSLHADRAFSQASSSYRRGKSDHLMGGAAAYYASVGHEQRKQQKAMLASAADAWVGQQSSANSLDLHGVTVEHAVRIARNGVENWWEALGDRKYRVGGIGSGYKIIVGVGTHSSQGIGRIGPAVSRMLMREGWKVNIQRGEVIVEGRARR